MIASGEFARAVSDARPRHLLLSEVVIGQLVPKGFSRASRAIPAGSLVARVPLDRVIGDPADRGELIDHQSDHRVVGGAYCGLVLADLAAGIDYAVSDAARVVGAGLRS